MSQFNSIPDPTNNGQKKAIDPAKEKENFDLSMRSFGASMHNSIVTGAQYYDGMNRMGEVRTGQAALRDYNARMETFSKALDSGAHSIDVSTWDKIRLDIADESQKHASKDGFWVESIHEGAWEQARSMTSDEHWGLLGTDLRARNQFMHDASSNSRVAKALGLENSPEYLAAVAARGVDTTKEGDVGDSLSSPFQSLFNYDDIADMVTKRRDPSWTEDAQDNAWEAMNSTPQGRYLIASTGMKRETLSRFTNQDALIYGMNRLYKEAKFQQHASADDWGGMIETFGQMLPTILNDPDTIGEVGLALLLAIPSGGTSVGVGIAAKAGKLGTTALRMRSVARNLATAGRLLPTRVLGDFVVPGVKALRATKESQELVRTSDRLRHAWNNLDAYDNWGTFLLGASADGMAGGVGAFLMNTDQIDNLNSVVYGKGSVPSIRNFQQVALRGAMGIGGAITLGSAMRVGFKGLTSMADASLKQLKSTYDDIRGADAKKAASTAVTDSVTRKIMAKAEIEDEGIITGTVAAIERGAASVGVAPDRVAIKLADEVDALEGVSGTPEEKAAFVHALAMDVIRAEFNSPAARDARELRAQEQAKAIAKGTPKEAESAVDAKVRDDIQTSAIVHAGKHGPLTREEFEATSVETAEKADPLMDELVEANTARDQAIAERDAAKRDAEAERKERKRTEKQQQEDLEKQQAEAEARNRAAQEAKDKQIAEMEKALEESKAAAAEAAKAQAEAEATAKAQAEAEASAKAQAEAAAKAEAEAAAKAKEAEAAAKAPAEAEAGAPDAKSDPKNDPALLQLLGNIDAAEARGDISEISALMLRKRINDLEGAGKEAITEFIINNFTADNARFRSLYTDPLPMSDALSRRAEAKAPEARGIERIPSGKDNPFSKEARWEWDIEQEEARVAKVKAEAEAEAAAKAQAEAEATAKAQAEAAAKAEAEAEEQAAKLEAERAEPAKQEEIPTERAPLTETTKKDAKKAVAEASQKVASKEDALKAVREAIAKKLGVAEIEVDAIAAQAVSWRMLRTTRRSAHDVVDGFEKEGIEGVPPEVLRQLLVELDPEYARNFDTEEALVGLGEARHHIEGAARRAQGNNLRALTEDPNAIFLASRFTRGAYEGIAKQLKEVEDAGPANAYKVAAMFKHAMGGGGLKDKDFVGAKAYRNGPEYFEAALDNLKQLQDTFSALDIKVDRDLDSIRAETIKEFGKFNDHQRSVHLRHELVSKFGYANVDQQWKDIHSDDLAEMVAYHRFVQQVDDLIAEGKLSGDQMLAMGIDPEAQRVYFASVLERVLQVEEELRSGGHSRWISEVEMLDIARGYYGKETQAGHNLRDSVFGKARGTTETTENKFDLAEVRRIAGDRLGRLDADFNRARSMAARAELERLEGKEKDGTADFSDRIRLAKYRNKNKVVNEIDYLQDEILTPYMAVAKEAADAKRREMGEEAWAAYLREEEDQLHHGVRDTLFGNQGLSKENRNALFVEHGIAVPMKQGSQTEKWKTAVSQQFAKLAAEDLGLRSGMDLVDGSASFVRGRQAGMALVGMYRDNATLTGDTAADIRADTKVASRGETYAHTAFSRARRQNPSGNLRVQKMVKFIEEYMLRESERQVLFNADGSPRNLTEEEVESVISFYEGLKSADPDEVQSHVPDHPFEQKARGLHLVGRAEKALGSPVRDWSTDVRSMAADYEKRMIKDPVNLHQGIHDDLTLAMAEGVALNQMGAVGPMTMRYSQGSGSLDALGAGWQTLAVVPGSIMDWMNIRSGMIFRQLEDMDKFARAIGLESLSEIASAIRDDILRKGNLDQEDIEIPKHIQDLKGKALSEAADKAGIDKKLKVGEKRRLLAQKEAGKTISHADAEKAAELMTLIQLDSAVRKVDSVIREQYFTGTLSKAELEEEINSWDAASQAVSLAKGLLNAAVYSAQRQIELSGKPDANTIDLTLHDMRKGIDDVMNAMGWDKTNGLLTSEVRETMAKNDIWTSDVGETLAEKDLATVAADFYSTVWDGMVDMPARAPSDSEPGRMSGFEEDEGEVFPTDFAYGNMRFKHEGMAEAGAGMWNFLFDKIGKFGSKEEIGEGIAAAKAGGDPDTVAQATMKKFLRNKLMKRPVMTRAYGAGGDAMTNAIADFLEEAFSIDTPEAAMFRGMVAEHDPRLAEQLTIEAQTGNRQASSLLYQTASSLGWAFADKSGDKWAGQGGAMGAILGMPDAKMFRDAIRTTASLHEATFADGSKVDLQIEWRGRDLGHDSTVTKGGEAQLRNITFDDLYTQRSIHDTVWEKESGYPGEPAKDKAEREERNRKATKENVESLYNQVREKAIEVAERRGWSKSYGDELKATLGRWHMRNLLLVEAGYATAAQVRQSEMEVSAEMHNILETSKTPEKDLEIFFENWLARRDEKVLRAMNTVGMGLRGEEAATQLGGVGLTPDDLDPKFALAHATGTPLHSSVHSSAGRAWTGGGQGAKGWENKVNPDKSVMPVYRAVNEEAPMAAFELTTEVARGWQDMSAEERRARARSIAAQDLMMDFLGTIKPPLDRIGDGTPFAEPTVDGFFRDWAANDHRSMGIREGMEEIRQEYRAAYFEKEGVLPDERADILYDDIRSQVPSTRSHVLFGKDDQEVMTDAGIPQIQLFRLGRTSDMNMRRRLEASKNNQVTGVGVTLSELAVPSRLKLAYRMPKFDGTTGAVSPTRSFGDMHMENDKAWLQNWTYREVMEYGASIDINTSTRSGFSEAFHLMHMERALQGAMTSANSKLKATENGEGFDLATPEGKKRFMDTVQRDINGYLEELYGGPEIAAKKEAGTRDVQQIPDTGTAYPATSFLGALRELFVQDNKHNWMHADALLGPAPRAGIVLAGDNRTSAGLLTGLMSKSVFGEDFPMGMGSAEEAVRFGHWFIQRKFGVDAEEAALKFEHYFARRLEGDDNGEFYEKALSDWQGAKVEQEQLPAAISSLMGLGSVRDNLKSDPEAMGLARKLFGIDKPEDLTDDFLLNMLNEGGSTVKTLMAESMGRDQAVPAAKLDSLGRALTLTRVPLKTLLWRTMAMYRNAGIDPKSQVMVRRLWFAAQLEMKIEKLGLVDQMGAREVNSRAFSHLDPQLEGKVSETRIDAARFAVSEVVPSFGWEAHIVAKGRLQDLAVKRGEQILDLYEATGQQVGHLKNEEGDGWAMDAATAAWAYHLAGGDVNKMQAIADFSSRGKRGGLEAISSPPIGSLDRGMLTDVPNKWWGWFNTLETGVDGEVRQALYDDVTAVMGGHLDTNMRRVNRSSVEAVIDNLEGREFVTDAAASRVVDDVESAQESKMVHEGVPDNEGPIFADGRTLQNEFDKIIREKRYPVLNSLIEKLQEHGVFKDEAAARDFGLMMAMNMDLLGDLLPGVKFQYTGETGTARMKTIVDNTSREMLHRIQVLGDMKGMEGIEVFDIIVHELGHAIHHRGQALAKGTQGGGKTNPLLTSLRSSFQRRVRNGTPEDAAAFSDAFVAIHGEKKGKELFTKFWNDVSSDDANRAGIAAQEFAAQLMSWYMLARTNTEIALTKFGPELAEMYRAGYGDRLRKVANVFSEPGAKTEHKGVAIKRQKPEMVLQSLARIANTAEPVRWSGTKQFNERYYNHSSNLRSEESLRRSIGEVEKEIEAAAPEDLPMLNNKLESLFARLHELGHATPSGSALRSAQMSLLNPGTTRGRRSVLRDAELSLDDRAALKSRLDAGETVPQEEFGRVNLKHVTAEDRDLIIDHMIDGKIAGRHETVGDSRFRSFAMRVGEGMALQGTSSAWRSTADEITYAANMLHSMLGFEERTPGQVNNIGMSQQEIQIMQRSLYGKPMTAAIELFEMAQKKDADFIQRVNNAFEAAFNNGESRGEALALLEEVSPHAANLVEVAADAFAKLYDRAYKNAVDVGEMPKDVVAELTGDGNRQLPVQLSQIVKEDGAMREMSIRVADGIRAEQLRRVSYDPGAGERAGFVNADLIHDFGLIAPWKDAMSAEQRMSHVDALDAHYGTDLVNSVIDEGKLILKEDMEFRFGGNRADEFFYASELIHKKIENGELFADGLPRPLVDAWKAAVRDGSMDRSVFTKGDGTPFYMRKLVKDFPDPKDQAKVKAILMSGSRTADPADYEAVKMLYRSRHGGYSFANSKYMNARAFSDIISQGIEGRGINRTPLNVMKTFMAFDHGIKDKFFNQEHYGITGFGYGDLLAALRRRVHRSRVSEKGTMVQLSDTQQQAALKEIKSLEDQYRLAQGRNPSYEDDSGNDFLEAIAPTIQTAVGLATTPNWTTASLIVEGTAGLVNRAVKMFTDGTSMTLPKYAGDMGAMRDSMHAIGITMPYHMTKLGFGHIWNMGDEASAAMDLDPSLRESFHDKANKKVRRLGSFAFERVQLAQREAAMIPAQQLLRKVLVPGASGESKAAHLAHLLMGERVKMGDDERVTAKTLRGLAKKAGVPADIASQLYSMGMLSYAGIRRLENLVMDYMPDNQFLKHEEMFEAVTWKPNREEGEGNQDILESGKAATALQQLLFQQVAKTNMEPQVGTSNLNSSPIVRMWQQLSQYSILFMRETMAALASTGLGATVGLLMPLYFGEVLWYSLNRMKNGDSPDKIREDWMTDPMGQMITAAARMPVFGAGSFLNDLAVSNATSAIGKLSGGAVFGSKANERILANTPGMPGPSMMIQSFTAFADLVKQGGAALLEGNPGEAARQAKEFLYKYGPVEGRPLVVAALRGATDDFKEAGKTPKGRRTPNLQIPTIFNALPEYRGKEPRETRLQERARNYGETKASFIAGFEPPNSGETAGDSSSAANGTGSPQTGSSGLSGPTRTPTGNAYGPGSAGSPLADKFGK